MNKLVCHDKTCALDDFDQFDLPLPADLLPPVFPPAIGPTKLADFRDTVDAMSIKGSTDFLMTLIAMLDIFVVAFLSEMVVIASFNKSLPSANLAATSNNDCVPSNFLERMVVGLPFPSGESPLIP